MSDFCTHPSINDRIREVKIQANKNNWLTRGRIIPPPNFVTESE